MIDLCRMQSVHNRKLSIYFSLYHDWFGLFCSPPGYISRIVSLRGSMTSPLGLTPYIATHVNKQYICEPNQSGY